MSRTILASILTLALAVPPVHGACQDPGSGIDLSGIRARVAAIQSGEVVEVRFRDGTREKVSGRLLSVRGESFDLQYAAAGVISTQTIAYGEVKLVKAKKGLSALAKTIIVVGIVTGGLFLGSAIAGAVTD